MGDNDQEFGPRLRELREQVGLTQAQLGEKVGVGWLAVSRWENGTREPGWGYIKSLADALGVSCEAFRQPAANREPSKPGRPLRTKAETQEHKPKRSRGRPRREKARRERRA